MGLAQRVSFADNERANQGLPGSTVEYPAAHQLPILCSCSCFCLAWRNNWHIRRAMRQCQHNNQRRSKSRCRLPVDEPWQLGYLPRAKAATGIFMTRLRQISNYLSRAFLAKVDHRFRAAGAMPAGAIRHHGRPAFSARLRNSDRSLVHSCFDFGQNGKVQRKIALQS